MLFVRAHRSTNLGMVLFEEFEQQGGYVLLELNLLAVGEHGSSEDKVWIIFNY